MQCSLLYIATDAAERHICSELLYKLQYILNIIANWQLVACHFDMQHNCEESYHITMYICVNITSPAS
jgi:hypothetical protein